MEGTEGGGKSRASWRKIPFEGPQGHIGDDLETIKYTSTDLKEGPTLEYRYRNHQLISVRKATRPCEYERMSKENTK